LEAVKNLANKFKGGEVIELNNGNIGGNRKVVSPTRNY
jgi:hypothetical protein